MCIPSSETKIEKREKMASAYVNLVNKFIDDDDDDDNSGNGNSFSSADPQIPLLFSLCI